ncbi:hypothetical protein [Lysobacter sp. cf310]|uniref:hypothetical protein n=1 Tax=Lysobacter sp. cf310 TaxID=1761790 RepID=UPI001113C653|nr:hypothetical protein [Lysobacter sp. cf310]
MDRRYRKRMQAYWARAEARGRRQIDRLDMNSWFDFWHVHVDWYGRGNTGPENVPEIAAATVRLLQYLETFAKDRSEPIQLWATLCSNTMDNAVHAHSRNPNGTAYPHGFHAVDWDPTVPDWVAAAVPVGTHQIGSVGDAGEVVYFVRRRG